MSGNEKRLDALIKVIDETKKKKEDDRQKEKEFKTYCKIDSLNRTNCKAFVAHITGTAQYLMTIHIVCNKFLFNFLSTVFVPDVEMLIYSQ